MASFAWLFFLSAVFFARAQLVEEVDVAIIGAGYSGLAAARELAKSGIPFRVLEARDRVGGRTLNWDVGGVSSADDVIELGGEWLAPHHKHARKLFHDLGFTTFTRPYNSLNNAAPPYGSLNHAAPPCAGDCVIQVLTGTKGWQQVAKERQVFGLLSQEDQEAVQRAQSAIQKAAEEVPCNAPMSHPNASFYDSLSYDAYLRLVHHLEGEAYDWLSKYADDAESLSEFSTLGVLYLRNCSDGVIGSAKEDLWRIRGGSQGPAQLLAERMQAHLMLGARVSQIHADGTGKHLVYSTKGNILAKHVLVAGLPPSLILGIDFQPSLPGTVVQFLQRFPLGSSLKYSLIYKTPWWRAAGYLGKIQILDDSASSFYTAECLDNSPYSWSRGVLMCFVEGSKNRAFMKLSFSQRKASILAVVREAFGEDRQDDIEDIVEHNWADDEYSRGAYSTFFQPGVLSDFWQQWSNISFKHQLGMPGIWVAGSDYSARGLGYMDGALSSGTNAATLISHELLGMIV